MTKKERLMVVFDDDTCSNSKAFRYTLRDPSGLTAEFEIKNTNRFKNAKRLIRKRMNDDLIMIVKGIEYRLISAEIVDETEDEYFSLANLKPVKN